ncbi:unnamed protein product [Cyclocybe aegerita]|uniref:Glyoxalase-like domain-containing protein n=1 Tax=Cyclocybe aegerita TaxID=1973307 RepID=A0A8S0VTR8_CYCAE|nr:unnamed protein product [Cyclocybe aegerita]
MTCQDGSRWCNLIIHSSHAARQKHIRSLPLRTKELLTCRTNMSNTDVNTRTLDHIVHLSPPGKLEETAQLFRGFGFTVLKGGVHIDGLTENNLVTFQDGTYVELIAFTHPVSYYPPGSPEHIARESHPWASKHPGWIDYAFLGNGLLSPLSSRISTIINARGESEGSGVHYTDEEPGGRTRPDGVALKWLITAPEIEKHPRRGVLPFFCGDVTPRNLRVSEDPEAVKHANCALGVSYLRVLVHESSRNLQEGYITSVSGSKAVDGTEYETTWALVTPKEDSGATDPKYQVVVPSSPGDDDHLERFGEGILVVGFKQIGRADPDNEVTTPYARIAWTSG